MRRFGSRKVPRRLRRWLHGRGDHRFCVVEERRVITGYDTSKRWLSGPLTVKPDGTFQREMIDITVFGGTPIYGTRKVHNPKKER